MKILLAGKNELAVSIFERLRSEHELGVITCASEAAESRRSSLKAAIAVHGLPALNSGAVCHDDIRNIVRDFRPDLLISAGFDRIFRPSTIRELPLAVNVHFGMLPKYRGSNSIPWAILNGEDRIGITLHHLAPGIDDGPIVDQNSVPNDVRLSCRDLYVQAVDVGTSMVGGLVELLESGCDVASSPQDEAAATYFPPDYPGDFEIPWRQTAVYIRNYIRAAHFPPFSPARSSTRAITIGFEHPVEIEHGEVSDPPGSVVQRGDRFGVTALNGWIFPGTVCDDHGTPTHFQDWVVSEGALGSRFGSP